MKRSLVVLSLFLLLMSFSGAAHSTTIQYFNQADFLAATGANSNGDVPNVGSVGPSATIGNITFASMNGLSLYFGTGPNGVNLSGGGGLIFDWAPALPGNDIAISGNESLRVTVLALSAPVYALGFDFFEPTGATTNVPLSQRIDSTFQVRLMNKSTSIVLDSFNFNAPDDEAYFVGAWTDFGFDRVEIVETTGGIDNEFFGKFYIGSTPVPEPATMLLLASGLVGLAGFRKRLRKR